jgi:biotin carboxyl carrier protein
VSEIRPLGNGRYAITDDQRTRIVYAVAAPGAQWVFADGQLFVLEAQESTSRRHRSGDDATALAAPMPATVVAVNVEPGQQVAAGDVMILLEAMKMVLPIKAPRDARVARIACSIGDLVQPGVQLVELDAAP